ncbi:MAG TPA: hypothetical protein VF519_05735 [Mycobacteriales bacterium]|jgi:uncharacterized protein YgiB involved in biofilm formation
MRLTTKAIAALGVAAAVVVPAVAANAQAFSVRNPANGCTYTVWAPTYTIKTLPTPGVTSTGGFGESVSCP